MSAKAERAITVDTPVRRLAQQALSRAAGAPLIGGKQHRAADRRAGQLRGMAGGNARGQTAHPFRELHLSRRRGRSRIRTVLCERAEAGVKVHVIGDWLGCLGQSRAEFWRPLIEAGGEVRSFNPFQFSSPFGWINRDHRKLLVVDRDTAFLGGVCVSAKWLGDKARGIAPVARYGSRRARPGAGRIRAGFRRHMGATWRAAAAVAGTRDRCYRRHRRSRHRVATGYRRHFPPRPAHCGDGAAVAVARRCLFCRGRALCAGVDGSRTRWGRRAPAGARRQRPARRACHVAFRLPPLARERHPRVRV